MKDYVSHKRVRAAQIVRVVLDPTSGAISIATDNPNVFDEMPNAMVARYTPVVGDYLVEYEDGYRSISPKKAFEDGYAEVPASAPDRTDRMMQFFEYAHLPPHLQEVSKPFCDMAQRIVNTLPANPERTVALRKLMEAKDCAVRALIYKES